MLQREALAAPLSVQASLKCVCVATSPLRLSGKVCERRAGGRDGWRSGKVYRVLERKSSGVFRRRTKPAENQVPGVDDGSALSLSSPSSSSS